MSGRREGRRGGEYGKNALPSAHSLLPLAHPIKKNPLDWQMKRAFPLLPITSYNWVCLFGISGKSALAFLPAIIFWAEEGVKPSS